MEPFPRVIAGPCSAETREQTLRTALDLKEAGITVFRAGLWKPRTRPGAFEGPGEAGLDWLMQVKEKTGMKVCTEVAVPSHVKACLEAGVDILWIGARTTANPFLVQEIATALEGHDIPVLVKNPVSPDLELWIGAIERLSRSGITRIGAIHRGFSTTSAGPYRNAPLWHIAVQLRSRYPSIPLIADPSHMGGRAQYVQELSQRAMDLGFDSLMIECHNNPAEALSDAAQQITPSELKAILDSLVIREKDSEDEDYLRLMSAQRAIIDEIDSNLIRLLSRRMEASRSIARYKKEHGVAILQPRRWEAVVQRAVKEGLEAGLSEEFVKAFMDSVHSESLRVQES